MNIAPWPKVDARVFRGVLCSKCHGPILFALDHGGGASETASAPTGKLILTCSLGECWHRADYSLAAVLLFRKRQDGRTERVER